MNVRSAFLGLLVGLTSHPTHAADLLEIYHLAQTSDPTFEAARYTLESVQQRIPQARAGLLPSIAANGNKNQTKSSASFDSAPSLNRDVHSRIWTLQLTQPLIRVQNVFAYTESEAQVEQATAQYAQAEQDLILRVSQAYFDVVVAEESIAVAEAQVNAMSEQLAIASRGFETGTTTITDVHEAKSRIELARSQRVAAVNELETKRSELEKIIGQTTSPLAVLQPTGVAPKPDPADPDSWINQARSNHPAVRAQQAALTAAEATINKTRSEHLPTLDLTASYGGNDSSGNATSPVDFTTSAKSKVVGVQFSMPIFSGGGTNAKVSEAIAIRYKTQADLETAKRQAGTDARQAYAGITNGLAQIAALDSAVESGKAAVKGNQVGYKLGIRINIDVLNAEQQLYTSQRDLTKARYDTLFQGLKLKAAAGVLSEADLGMINGLLMQRPPINPIKEVVASQKITTPTPAVETSQGSEMNQIKNELLATFDAWRNAWAARDIEAYLSYYENGYCGSLTTHQAWEKNRRKALTGSADPIELGFEDVDVTLNGDDATLSARQSYRSARVSDVAIKKLGFRWVGGRWVIVREGFVGRK